MIFLLDDRYPTLIPDPEQADENGMVAVSETLGIQSVYRRLSKRNLSMDENGTGTNYWCWFSLNPRMVLKPSNLNISRSLKKAMTSSKFEIRIDHSFEDTMRLCASPNDPGQESTWIEDEMIKDYSNCITWNHTFD